jgi:ribosomal protein S12 methylthiotransferase accessory factor YcaO
LANAAGKGFTLVAATVSAAMEAVEIYHAEAMQLDVIEASWADLPEDARIARDLLPLNRLALFDAEKPYHWVEAWDLMGQRPVYVPQMSVGMAPPAGQRPLIDRPFAMGSNGLAGGNHLLEAIAAGLYEVVERDAVACDRLLVTTIPQTWRRVDPRLVDDPSVADLLRRLAEADLELVLIDCTVDTGVPCYMAFVFEAAYIEGPSGRTQAGVAIDWKFGGGAVGDIVIAAVGGQVLDGWSAAVRADITPDASAPERTQLKVRVTTTFSRSGEEDQVAVSDVVLMGDGRQQTRHGADRAPEAARSVLEHA